MSSDNPNQQKGCPNCLVPVELEHTEHPNRQTRGRCLDCEDIFDEADLILVGEDRWRVRLINMNEMTIEVDETYNDQRLTRLLISQSDIWNEVLDLEDAGIKFRFKVERVVDYHHFVVSYLQSKDWFVYKNRAGWITRDIGFKVEDCQKNTEAGHPDFKIVPLADGGDKSQDIDLPEPVYIEFKYNGDSLRNNQFEWILNAIRNGNRVYLMRVEEL